MESSARSQRTTVLATDGSELLTWNSIFYQTFASYSFKYYLIWISALFAFLPLFLHMSDNVESTILGDSLRDGTMYYESSILLVGFSCILAIDLLVDILNEWFGNKMMSEKKAKFMVQRISNAEKLLLVLGLIIQPIIAFLPRTTPHLTMIWLCCHKCQKIAVFCPIFLSWYRLYSHTWSPFSSSVATVFGLGGFLLSDFSIFMEFDPSISLQSIGSHLYVAGQVCMYLAVAYNLINALVWLWRTGRKLWHSSHVVKKEIFSANKIPTPSSDKDKSNEESIFAFGYILFTFISLVFVFSTTGGADALQVSPMGLLKYNIAFIVMALCFINFHLRHVQYEAIVNLCLLVEAKRNYVRYMSHELRTPLNSASLGLKLILDQLRGSNDPDDEERYETLQDVHGVCMAAVDILVTTIPCLYKHL